MHLRSGSVFPFFCFIDFPSDLNERVPREELDLARAAQDDRPFGHHHRGDGLERQRRVRRGRHLWQRSPQIATYKQNQSRGSAPTTVWGPSPAAADGRAGSDTNHMRGIYIGGSDFINPSGHDGERRVRRDAGAVDRIQLDGCITHTHRSTHTHTRTHSRTKMRTYVHTCIYTYKYIHTYIHTSTHTHTHTHTQ